MPDTTTNTKHTANKPTDKETKRNETMMPSPLEPLSNMFLSLLPSSHKTTTPQPQPQPPRICIPINNNHYGDASHRPHQPCSSRQESSVGEGGGFPSSTTTTTTTVRIASLNSDGKGGGPAFVGQVFSMCDLSGTGLMAVSTHFHLPFLSKRTPEWLKKIFAAVTKSERSGPVFRFFIDLGDAVSYVKRLNIPSGVVGACRLDLAYEHFKEKPHLFQFVPNEKQVKAANQLLKTISKSDGKRKIDGVPVFSAKNLDIAIATSDGIKWYTPYFFDKNVLDNILDESVDQHFHALIQSRHMQRRRDVIDDNLSAEVVEEMGDNLVEPPEVQEVLDEMGHPGIPLSVISKAAEIQLLYAVDKVLLGNRWLRKATGIQPKYPYMVDSFEKRSASSFRRSLELASSVTNSKINNDASELELRDNHEQRPDIRLPFQHWLSNPWLKQLCGAGQGSDIRSDDTRDYFKESLNQNPFLPKITMVGISTGDTSGQATKASLKKTMEDLTRELEHTDQGSSPAATDRNDFKVEERDPLFVANVGDYYTGMSKTSSPRWVRGGNK